MLKLLHHQPFHVGWPPRRLARIDASQPQHQRRDLLALALEILLHCLTGAREIAHGLMALVRHPHRGELARAQQLGEAYRITPVRLHSITGPLRNERGGHHQALVAEALEQSVESISCRPFFIAKRQMTVCCCKLYHQLSDRCLRGKEFPEKPYLAATAAIGNSNGITQF